VRRAGLAKIIYHSIPSNSICTTKLYIGTATDIIYKFGTATDIIYKFLLLL
jgi:hypothetical protein